MIVRAGTAVSIPVLFASGRPDGDVIYTVYDPAGVVVSSGAVVVPADAVSVFLQIGSALTALPPNRILSYHDVVWSYEVDGQTVNDELRYTVEARLPFGVSKDGVRSKLGVDKKDLPDNDISLAKAYLAFQTATSTENVDMSDSARVATVGDAIEAVAALSLIPTMAVRVASKESSGTNQYQRQDVDWSAVQSNLEAIVSAGYAAVDPTYDETAEFGSLLIVVTPAVDRYTGA